MPKHLGKIVLFLVACLIIYGLAKLGTSDHPRVVCFDNSIGTVAQCHERQQDYNRRQEEWNRILSDTP